MLKICREGKIVPTNGILQQKLFSNEYDTDRIKYYTTLNMYVFKGNKDTDYFPDYNILYIHMCIYIKYMWNIYYDCKYIKIMHVLR